MKYYDKDEGRYMGTYIEDGVSYPQSLVSITSESVLVTRMKVGNITADLTERIVFIMPQQQFLQMAILSPSIQGMELVTVPI